MSEHDRVLPFETLSTVNIEDEMRAATSITP